MTTKTKVTIDERFFSALQEMPTVLKDKKNDFTKAKYATLNAILDAVKPILTKHGLAIFQTTKISDDGKIFLITSVVTEDSKMEIFSLPLLEDLDNKNSAHSLGKAITYIRRYSIVTALCLATEDDDDGNSVQRKQVPKAPPKVEKTMEVQRKECLDALAKAGAKLDDDTKEIIGQIDDRDALVAFYKDQMSKLSEEAK